MSTIRSFRAAAHRRLRGPLEPSDLPKSLRTKLRAIVRSITKLRGATLSANDAFAEGSKIRRAIERFEQTGRREGYPVYDAGRVLWRDVADAADEARERYSRHLKAELHAATHRAREALPAPGTYEHELALMRGGAYRRDARRRRR